MFDSVWPSTGSRNKRKLIIEYLVSKELFSLKFNFCLFANLGVAAAPPPVLRLTRTGSMPVRWKVATRYAQSNSPPPHIFSLMFCCFLPSFSLARLFIARVVKFPLHRPNLISSPPLHILHVLSCFNCLPFF